MKYIASCRKDIDSFPVVVAVNERFFILLPNDSQNQINLGIEKIKKEYEFDDNIESKIESFVNEFLRGKSFELTFNNAIPTDCIIDGYYDFNRNTLEEVNITELTSGRVDYRNILRINRAGFIKIYTIINNPLLPEPVVVFTKNLLDFCQISIESNSKGYCIYELVAEHFPGYKPEYERWKAKIDISTQLEPNDSLAYLEAQIDIISQIIIEMIKNNPAVKKVYPYFEGFEEIFNKTNLFGVKKIEDCLKEITQTKTKVRKLQDTYYKATKEDYKPKPPLTIEELKKTKKQKINTIRNMKEQGIFIFNGKPYDADSISVQRIAVAAQNALTAKIMNAHFEIDWTLADNSIVKLNAEEMLGVSQALALHAATVHTIAKELKEIVDEVQTAEEIEAITWPA